jgi:hypothetical protein
MQWANLQNMVMFNIFPCTSVNDVFASLNELFKANQLTLNFHIINFTKDAPNNTHVLI